jgi:Uma2 family endonuclease
MPELPIVLQIPPSLTMTDEQFFDFCQVNWDLRIERNCRGEVAIMPPGRFGNWQA